MTGGKSGDRGLSVRVKKKRGIKASSRRWLERQLNDPYVRRSKAEGYRSRAAYKLIEIDDRHKLLKPGMRVVDLGCAPGGWCQVAVARVNALGERGGKQGTVLGVLHEAHMPMLSRNLVYTALTRAREGFYAAGSASSWHIAATRQRETRNTALLERIRHR